MDIQEGRCTIDTWERLKQELRSQFFPENVEILARRKLRELRHTGTIREYVKQFAGLMLDIRDMSEKDKVFCFVEGLKPWAKSKLYEQRVQSLSEAYAAAERLFDLSKDPSDEQSQDVRRTKTSPRRDSGDYRPSSPKETDLGVKGEIVDPPNKEVGIRGEGHIIRIMTTEDPHPVSYARGLIGCPSVRIEQPSKLFRPHLRQRQELKLKLRKSKLCKMKSMKTLA